MVFYLFIFLVRKFRLMKSASNEGERNVWIVKAMLAIPNNLILDKSVARLGRSVSCFRNMAY